MLIYKKTTKFVIGLAASIFTINAIAGDLSKYADPEKPALPPTSVTVSLNDTALVITDPQIDFLSPDGVTWGVVGESVLEHKTVEHIGQLLDTAKASGMQVFVSPHHYYPTDHSWKFEGPLEVLMHKIGMFNRKGAYTTEGFDKSGSDFMPEYKAQILDGEIEQKLRGMLSAVIAIGVDVVCIKKIQLDIHNQLMQVGNPRSSFFEPAARLTDSLRN